MSTNNNLSESASHRLRKLQSRRNPGLQRGSLRTFIDKLETFYLAFDPENRGEAEGWFIPGRKKFERLVEIGSIELLPDYVPSTTGKTVVWYQRTLEIPKAQPGKHYKINFARAFYRTKVWVGGKLLADVDDQTEHISGFSSFSYDLTNYLDQNGRVELIIRVENSVDPTICRGKQWSTTYPHQGIWYGHTSGLWGQVTVEEVSANRLRSDVEGYADPNTGWVKLRPITYITEPGDYELIAKILTPGSKGVVEYKLTLPLLAGQHMQELSFRVPEPILWSPRSPVLYRTEISLYQEGTLLDRIHFNIGFREIKAKGNILEFNGSNLYINSILYQPYHGDSFTMNYAQLKADMEYTRKVTGANLLRIHIAGADPLALHIADELGLMLWLEIPSPHISNEYSRLNHFREINTLLRQIGTHPSVVCISLYNESWGCEDIDAQTPDGEATRTYIKTLYRQVKEFRPDLLVIDNDGWQHLSEKGELIATDILTMHVYESDLTKWNNDLANILDLVQPDSPRFQQLTGKTAIVGNNYHYHGEKPIIISEWGGFGAIYGGPATQAEKFSLIKQYKASLQQSPNIAGDCYTQLGDVEQEVNGLLDKNRLRLQDPAFLDLSKDLLM